ncbi:MAG: beta strand repeat-containing protein [Thermodesulfobacteriota bacterium]
MKQATKKRNAVKRPAGPLGVRVVILVMVMACGALATPAQAAYDVTIIESGASSGGSWAGYTWTASASGAQVLASEIASHLNFGSTVIGTGVDGAENGDITVNGSVDWSAHTLTLRAARHIVNNAVLNATAVAGLALEFGQGAVAAGNTASYRINAPVNLAATGSFSTRYGSDGGTVNHTIITTLGAEDSVTGTDLQGIRANLGGHFVMGADISAAATMYWNQDDFDATRYYGFKPLGGNPYMRSYANNTPFFGTFDGLGHVITTLYINSRPSAGAIAAGIIPNFPLAVGLFGYTGSGSDIRNIGLVGAFVSATDADSVGALVGMGNGSIGNCFSTGFVRGDFGDATRVGGLVGNKMNGPMANSYSTATVIGDAVGGGLVGENNGDIINSFSSGLVDILPGANTYRGGLIGIGAPPFLGQQVFDSFWDMETSGMESSGSGWEGGTGLTTAQMRQLASFTNWDIDAAGGAGATWRLYEGHAYPLLASFMTPLTVTADDIGVHYDGAAYNFPLTNVGYSVAPDMAHLFNTATPYNGARNAGSHPPDLYSDQWRGYNIRYVGGTLTIIPRPLAITGSGVADKVYDAVTTAVVTPGTLTGLISGETLGVSASGVFADKEAGTGKSVAVTYALSDGSGLATNYSLAGENLTANITPRPLTIMGSAALDKVYDGTGTATITPGILSGLASTCTPTCIPEAFGVSASGTFADKNVGTGKNVTVNYTLIEIGSGLAGNYSLAGETLTADIIAAPLTIAANAAGKTYDGLAWSGGNGVTYAGFVGGETVAVLGGTLVYGGSSQGAVLPGDYTITPSGLTAANYAIAFVDGVLTISKADQTITFAPLPDRTYGDADFPVSATATSGLSVSYASTTTGVCMVSGDTVSLVAPGTCSLTASQAGDAQYNAAADVSRSFMVRATVTPSAGTNGSISPATPQVVAYTGTAAFTIVPATGYHVDTVAGTCGGSFTGDPSDTVNGILYTTNAVTVDCTVEASFTINQYTVTPSAEANGGISPATPQIVDYNATASFTIVPATGYHVAAVAGTCGGSFTGDPADSVNGILYTTNAVTNDCTVQASFAINQYTVSVVAGPNGSLDGSMQFPQGVDHGSTTQVIFHADTDYFIASITGCGINYVNGDQSITTRSETTPPITGNCTVTATFAINTHQLSVIVQGRGSVTADSGGIDCPGTCAGTYDHNSVVTLTPTPEKGGKFIGWSGETDCEDGVVIMTGDLACTAEFSHFEWWSFWPVIMKAAQDRQQGTIP